MKNQFADLAEVRRDLLRLDAGFVSDHAGIRRERLAAIEAGHEPPSIAECHALAAIYGIAPRLLGRTPIRLSPGDGISTLAQSSEFHRMGPLTRLRIVAAANAARSLVELEALAGEAPRYDRFNREFVRLPPPARRGRPPYAQGRHYARALRHALGVRGPVPSMRDFAAVHFPAVAVLYAHFGQDADIGGLAFADARRGATIVLNLDGRNQNPLVRRFSLAHELCHLLVDWNRMQPLALISEVREDAELEVEQRANAFAVQLICPEQAALALRARSPDEAIRSLVDRWGLHYRAARLYLNRAAGFDDEALGRAPAVDGPERWASGEIARGIEDFPVDAVPAERRTLVARWATALYLDGIIDRVGLARHLALAPSAGDAIDAVLAHFGATPAMIRARRDAETRAHPLRGEPYRMADDFHAPLPEWEAATGP